MPRKRERVFPVVLGRRAGWSGCEGGRSPRATGAPGVGEPLQPEVVARVDREPPLAHLAAGVRDALGVRDADSRARRLAEETAAALLGIGLASVGADRVERRGGYHDHAPSQKGSSR
jgi:hypothetical protein